MAFGTSDLRTFCRQMGVSVSFQGVVTYPDGEPVKGLFDIGGQDAGFGETTRVEDARYTLELPFNAFNPMPESGDELTVLDGIAPGNYAVRNSTALDDGSMIQLSLKQK